MTGKSFKIENPTPTQTAFNFGALEQYVKMILPSDLLNPTGKAGSALVSWAVYAYLEFVNGVNLNTN